MTARFELRLRAAPQAGQASLLLLGVLAALLAAALILFGFGQALGARGKHQRAADLAAVSGAQVMRREYARLFEPALLADGVPNPRHLANAAYLELARAAALRGARRNGVPSGQVEVGFPDVGFAPTRIVVAVRGHTDIRLGTGRPRDRIEVGARATAEVVPGAGGFGMPTQASGGGYSGPLAYRQGKPMRPDVAAGFDRMAAAAHGEAGLSLLVTSAIARTPSRPASGLPTRIRSGWRRPAPACIATRPSSTSDRPPPTGGWPPTATGSASSSATHGSRGTTRRH